MKIDHLAIWVDDLEGMRGFYGTYFSGVAGTKYTNPTNHYNSYFLTFETGGARLELMHQPDVGVAPAQRGFSKGLAHIAISVGSREAVDQLTERLRADRFTILSEPRTTGDGYYESVVADPEGNWVEIVA